MTQVGEPVGIAASPKTGFGHGQPHQLVDHPGRGGVRLNRLSSLLGFQPVGTIRLEQIDPVVDRGA